MPSEVVGAVAEELDAAIGNKGMANKALCLGFSAKPLLKIAPTFTLSMTTYIVSGPYQNRRRKCRLVTITIETPDWTLTIWRVGIDTDLMGFITAGTPEGDAATFKRAQF